MRPKLQRILCVDDEEDILELVKEALESVGGFQVDCCISGHEALERISELKPDMLLLDAMMPQMDGPTMLQALRLRHEFHYLPVVFMTARVQMRELEEYVVNGALGVIPKPFDPMLLSKQVINIWNQCLHLPGGLRKNKKKMCMWWRVLPCNDSWLSTLIHW